MLQVFICVGILVAYLVGLPYMNNKAAELPLGSGGVAWWRVMLAIGIIPAASQVCTPSTPFRCLRTKVDCSKSTTHPPPTSLGGGSFFPSPFWHKRSMAKTLLVSMVDLKAQLTLHCRHSVGASRTLCGQARGAVKPCR